MGRSEKELEGSASASVSKMRTIVRVQGSLGGRTEMPSGPRIEASIHVRELDRLHRSKDLISLIYVGLASRPALVRNMQVAVIVESSTTYIHSVTFTWWQCDGRRIIVL